MISFSDLKELKSNSCTFLGCLGVKKRTMTVSCANKGPALLAAILLLPAGLLRHFTAITKMEIVKMPRRIKAIVLIQLVDSNNLIFASSYPVLAISD